MEPTNQKLHDRAFESAKETRQHLVTMATASLGIFFLALMGNEIAVRTIFQKIVLIVAMVSILHKRDGAGYISASYKRPSLESKCGSNQSVCYHLAFS